MWLWETNKESQISAEFHNVIKKGKSFSLELLSLGTIVLFYWPKQTAEVELQT